jgi:hypothetical protein
MAILSIDLATRRWSDLGIVVLNRARPAPSSMCRSAGPDLPPIPVFSPPIASSPATSPITCEIILWDEAGLASGPVDAEILAGRLNHFCAMREIRVLMLDGPQAWKSRHNGLAYARVSERQLNTATKTGLPGMVKPLTSRPFTEFCLDLYEALCRRGWRRFETSGQPGSTQQRILVESSPQAAWKSLGIKPLPPKRRAMVSDLAAAYAALRALIPFTTSRPPNHDQLQAIVGGLPGLALEEHNSGGARIVGNPPRREDGHWREGFIVLPLPPMPPLNVRWLH